MSKEAKPLPPPPVCEVCEKEPPVGIASLPFAAMSVAFGQTCILNNAYPIWACIASIECVGGKQNCAEWFLNLNTFLDGKYILVKDIPDSELRIGLDNGNIQS